MLSYKGKWSWGNVHYKEEHLMEPDDAHEEWGGALDTQVGGDHYKKYPVQPIEIMYMYGTTPAIGKVLKYILRYRGKNGKIDLLKARQCLDIAIELEYNTDTKEE